ncbi:addiction module protein [Pendulispora albinea]|uniref:Addiction module protein n=1 Tax=Pendulispora albinea TaxID=2741071 RepID=A0ABZ2MCD5_9BACT
MSDSRDLKDARTFELIQSLEGAAADPDAPELWKREIARRVDDIEAGTAELEDWEEVRDRLRAATAVRRP